MKAQRLSVHFCLMAAMVAIAACGPLPATPPIAIEPSATRQPPAPTPTAVPLTLTPTATPTSAPTPTPTATPVPLSRLRVVGNEIQNENGEVVVLRGAAIADPAILSYQGHWTVNDYQVLAEEWGAEIIRVPIHPSTWEHEPDYAKKYLDPIVEWGERYGLYIFLGYHAHGNPITNQVEEAFWWEGSPWGGKLLYDPDLELARSALATIAERYKDEPHVLYGTFNEPSYIDWRDWRPVAEELVDVIHAINPEALVFVSGTDWGYDLCGAISDPVRRNNVVYEIHPYPWSGEGWQVTVDQLARTAPVFIGEWGFSIEHPDDDGYVPMEDYGIPLIQFADEHGIGWTAWVWHPEWTPRMLKSWTNYTSTGFGLLVKNSLTAGTPILPATSWALPTPYPVEESLVIFDDSWGPGWEIWSWESEFDIGVESVVNSGRTALGVTLDAEGGIGLYTPQDISSYGYLEFYINGGSQGGQSLEIYIYDLDNELVLARRSPPCLYIPNEWFVFRFPIQDLDLANRKIVINITARGSHPPPQFFLDDIRLVSKDVPTHSLTLQPIVVYDDELAEGWSVDPWGGQVDLNSSKMVYEGAQAIEVSLQPSVGITFDKYIPLEVTDYTWLVFYLNGGETADQRLFVEMKSGDNIPLGERAYLVDDGYIEGYPLQPGGWHRVAVPLSLLNPQGLPFAWFDIGDASGNGASTFYVDEIRFVAAGP